MPKILINENDKTSPGTAERYSNYAVLVTGFKKTTTGEELIEADSNGVYEFNSIDTFDKTIGEDDPEHKNETTGETYYHYGNQMARALLKLGYPIIYKPIEVDDFSDMRENSFWEIFKDKANYDFRFITHGFLSSVDLAEQDNYKKLLGTKSTLEEKKKVLNSAKSALEDIEKEINPELTSTEQTTAKDEEYNKIKDDYPGFSKDSQIYSTFEAAKTGVASELTTIEDNLETTATSIGNIESGIAIPSGLIDDINLQIAKLAEYNKTDTENDKSLPGRGDCIALLELDERKYIDKDSTTAPEVRIINAINELSDINSANGKYCALTVPSVIYKTSNGTKKFPGAFHYLACFMNSIGLGFSEWYAAAGYTRGISSYIIDHTSVKLGEIAINALEPRCIKTPASDYPKFACNVIANFRGSYYLWGNRTAHPLGTEGDTSTGDLVASSFLNIRQLCTTIKKQLYVACRRFTFDPNSDTLWFNFVNAIRPTLELMKADQGIRDYKILKETTDVKATLKAKIRIIPIEAVEDFDLEVTLEDAFGETTATVAD